MSAALWCQGDSEVELHLAVQDAACDTPTHPLWTTATPTSMSPQSAVLASSPPPASAADAAAASQAAAAATAAAAADHDAAYAAAAKRWICPSPEVSETPSIADTSRSQFSRCVSVSFQFEFESSSNHSFQTTPQTSCHISKGL